jgi:hypothetical protein
MKHNVQLYTADELYDEIFNYHKTRAEDIRLDENGYMTFTHEGKRTEIAPNELAYKLNMPLWEVCVVARGEDDVLAMMFFE